MSVIFMDSFQHYVTADILKKWSETVGSNVSISAASGRRGGNALLIGMSSSIRHIFSATMAGVIVGFAAKTAMSTTSNQLVDFLDGSTSQVQLKYDSDGTIKAYRGAVLLGSSAPGALPLLTWAYLEVSVVAHNSAGALTVKVNGTTVLTLTGIDTADTANNYVTSVKLSTVNNQTFYVNDLYVIDPATAPNTAFLGDVRVDAYYPMADGATGQWTPTPSGAHYANVDEASPNGTDYIEADVAGYIDLFQTQDLAVDPGASGFFAVQVCAAALKTDAGSRQIKSVVRRSAVNYSGVAKDVSETQKYVLNQWNTDPSTAAAWTKAGFDAAEFGVELV